MKVHEAVAERLSRLGVGTTFGLVGSGNFGLVDHMTRHCGIAYHASRHEAAAVAMAPVMKIEVDPKTEFPYLLPLQWHMDQEYR